MSKKPITKQQKAFRFYRTAWGHVVLAAMIWVIGFNLLLLATDTGSLLQWGGVLVSLFWGLYHLALALKLALNKLTLTKKTGRKAR